MMCIRFGEYRRPLVLVSLLCIICCFSGCNIRSDTQTRQSKDADETHKAKKRLNDKEESDKENGKKESDKDGEDNKAQKGHSLLKKEKSGKSPSETADKDASAEGDGAGKYNADLKRFVKDFKMDYKAYNSPEEYQGYAQPDKDYLKLIYTGNIANILIMDNDYVFPDSSAAVLGDNEIQSKESFQIRRGINEIYARHGRIFTNEGQKHYFESRSWYNPSIPAQQFNENVFNSYEKENIRKLQKELDQRGEWKDAADIEGKAIAFLREAGINGFLWERFGSVDDNRFSINMIVYQMDDKSISYNQIRQELEKRNIEIDTDISYISRTNLDKLARRATGYGLADKVWGADEAYNKGSYIDTLDAYYLIHGDTNYIVFAGEMIDMDRDSVCILCNDFYSYNPKPYVVTLKRMDDGDFRFISIQNLYEDVGDSPSY